MYLVCRVQCAQGAQVDCKDQSLNSDLQITLHHTAVIQSLVELYPFVRHSRLHKIGLVYACSSQLSLVHRQNVEVKNADGKKR
jgi:hypothetical protein